MARFSTELMLWNLAWGIRLTLSQVRAEGRIYPRLVLTFDARTLIPECKVQIVQLKAGLSFQGEILGTGWAHEVGREIDSTDSALTFGVPLTHHAISFVNEHVRDHKIQFTLQFSGAVFARDDRPSRSGRVVPQGWRRGSGSSSLFGRSTLSSTPGPLRLGEGCP